ncbi:MAG: hypothetical protein LBQ71_02275 [Hungatella sp.]|jgi:hypothetical protein|nr:hypothetical protein [Hungatella sp.]
MGKKIEVGDVLVHSNVIPRMNCIDLAQMIERHKNGDWGDISQAEKSNNDAAVKNNGRIVSAFCYSGELFMIITEADRRLTLVISPDDYARTYASVLNLKRSQTKDLS